MSRFRFTRRNVVAWSYGGGVQSVAIAVLIRTGALPTPDLAVIADTGREKQTTWDYLRDAVQPYLAPTGLTIAIAPHSLSRVDLYAPTSDKPLVPAYTAEGRLPGYCSGEWKRDVCERWLRAQDVSDCDLWIGYSMDELGRVMAKDHRPWCRYRFPLIDRFITRAMCLRLIEAAGLPRAHKSRCFDCPHQTPAEWAEVRASPSEWSLAVERDALIRQQDEQQALYLYSGRVPLPLADFAAANHPDAPARPCEGGNCFT